MRLCGLWIWSLIFGIEGEIDEASWGGGADGAVVTKAALNLHLPNAIKIGDCRVTVAAVVAVAVAAIIAVAAIATVAAVISIAVIFREEAKNCRCL